MAGTNPRAVRIAGLIQRVVATALEKDIHDPRLRNVTITEVRVTNDMQQARIFWTIYAHNGHEEGQKKRAAQALRQAQGHLRTMVGRKAGLRLTPQLIFVFDALQGSAAQVDDVLVVARKRDEELAKMRENAQYAGEEDPYKHKDEDEQEDEIADIEFDDYDDEYNDESDAVSDDDDFDDLDDFDIDIIIDDEIEANEATDIDTDKKN
ncbi:30S ribosome-binding factor RbfA [Alloscardovia theropitheci]|uniref:Ribosome-binding factor A n=1 Tax=Alloscardovia theropitheci TaxID=2496842 RepID=A0A4V2MU43_9BIFI|nr:30S ribosome-binding factor RbfA [Alloscardovia theropitheci]TCD54939.1 30S ribosome-binding factor RbfA [Alloscardovia theropitheci]